MHFPAKGNRFAEEEIQQIRNHGRIPLANVFPTFARYALGVGAGLALLTLGLGASAQTQPSQSAPAASGPVSSAVAAENAQAGSGAAAPATQPQDLTEGVVATVNDQIISTYDVIQRMRLLIVTAGIHPSQDNLPEIQAEALRSLIDEDLEMQELQKESKTQKFDLIASKSDVDGELADIARSNNTSADQLLARLAAEGVEPQTLRDQLKAEISWRGWIRGRYGTRLAIGDDQVKAYRAQQEAAQSKPQYEVSEIFIDAGRAGGEDEAVKAAGELVAQLQKGAPFAAVARQFSASPTAANGGDVGWIAPGEMPAPVDAAIAQLRPGQLSAPIPVKDGAYIIYLKQRRAPGAEMVYNLDQAAISLPKDASASDIAAAQAKLEALRGRITGCDNVQTVAAKVPGVVVGNLGDTEINDLAPAFRDAAEALPVGGVSEPIRTDVGLHLLVVCNKHRSGAETLTNEEIENRLYGEELTMIAKRYLRDLRNQAVIDIK
ncbi:MAG: peptidylprolyl isomerase [Caulobacteraceae bacterium]